MIPAPKSMPFIDERLDALAAAVVPLQAEVDALHERVTALEGKIQMLVDLLGANNTAAFKSEPRLLGAPRS